MIELKEVTKQFDDFKVLDKISLTIPKGAAFGLLGSNGRRKIDDSPPYIRYLFGGGGRGNGG